MPEHAHLLVSKPADVLLSVALQALKISVAKRLPESPFWTVRYHDFNVHSRRGSYVVDQRIGSGRVIGTTFVGMVLLG